METRTHEVADGIYQLATFIPDAPVGFNQYLVLGDEPLLFHTGMRGLFPLVSEAVQRIIPLDALRWVSFGHFEADECGALNEWLGVAADATAVQGMIGCMVSLGDVADREPRPLADGEVLDIGGHRLRWLDTPHVPHSWDAGVMYDETTRTLLCGDLFTRYGDYPVSTDDLLGPAIEGDQADGYSSWSLTPSTGDTVRRLAALDPATIAPMHAPGFSGDGRQALDDLATGLVERIG